MDGPITPERLGSRERVTGRGRQVHLIRPLMPRSARTRRCACVGGASRRGSDSERNRASNVWGGVSGDAFAVLVRQAVTDMGRTANVTTSPVSPQTAPPGAYLVDVSVDGGPGLLYEVADWVEGARVMDPHGEDLTLPEALDYLRHRIMGVPPSKALKTVWTKH